MIRTASVYDRRPVPGTRVLVTHYWPRGFRRGSLGRRMRDLAPSAPLLKRYRAGLPWKKFEGLYRIEMDGEAAGLATDELRWLAVETDIIMLCYEPDGQPCHRHILLDILVGAPGN